MDDAELARCAHLNMVEAFASLARLHPAGFLRRAGGVVIASTGSPLALFNEVLPVAGDVDPRVLIEAVETLGDAGLPFLAQLREGVDEGLVPAARELGLEEAGDDSWPAMILTQIPSTHDAPEGLRIVHMVGSAGYADFVRSGAALWRVDPDLYASWLAGAIMDDPAWDLFIGYAEDAPVSMSMSFHADGVVGVYNVGTAAPFRRRGYGWALTLAAIMAGVDAGCTIATLQSSAMAMSIYQAHGFRTLYRYRAFREPSREDES